MAINQNHLFEELNGIKCAIVEKNASPARTGFLRRLLEYNRYTVVVVPSPPPKVAAGAVSAASTAVGAAAGAAAAAPSAGAAAGIAAPSAGAAMGVAVAASSENVPAGSLPTAPAPAAAAPDETMPPAPPPPPETFTIGVTDVAFNPTNAIFGRLLKTSDGHIVTLAYWQQKAAESHDEIPYFAS